MCAKCSYTLSKWAIWHYTPLNTPNGRQRKPLFVIFGRQTKSKFMDRKWSKKCIYEPFWSSENGFWPYLLYLRRCICQAQIHSRYQLPSAPILLFSKQTLLHFETKKKPHTFKTNLVYSSISCSCSRCWTNICLLPPSRRANFTPHVSPQAPYRWREASSRCLVYFRALQFMRSA